MVVLGSRLQGRYGGLPQNQEYPVLAMHLRFGAHLGTSDLLLLQLLLLPKLHRLNPTDLLLCPQR